MILTQYAVCKPAVASLHCGGARPLLSSAPAPMPHLIVFLMLCLLGLLVACMIT